MKPVTTVCLQNVQVVMSNDVFDMIWFQLVYACVCNFQVLFTELNLKTRVNFFPENNP